MRAFEKELLKRLCKKLGYGGEPDIYVKSYYLIIAFHRVLYFITYYSVTHYTYIRINSCSNYTSMVWICLHTVVRTIHPGISKINHTQLERMISEYYYIIFNISIIEYKSSRCIPLSWGKGWT